MDRYRNFDLALYVTAQDVIAMPDDLDELRRQFSFFSRSLRVGKVYLETYRDGAVPSAKLLSVKAFFDGLGISTATGIMNVNSTAVGAPQRIGYSFCYTDPDLLRLLETTFERMAREFDEIMIDDCFFTNCTCERCRKEKGDRTWTAFRLDRMIEIGRTHIIEPAKRINPNVHITLKYPTWGESFQRLGYNPEIQPFDYDAIYAGTETRHTTYSIFRNPRYTSFTLIRWLDSIQGNNLGGWFDPYMCGGSIDTYLEQAYLTLFSRPREITLFCYGSLLETALIPALGFELDRFDRFLGELGDPTGVCTYLPLHGSGEDHVYDYLGMAGVPVAPTVHFPEDEATVLLTGAAACDENIVERIREHLIRGGDVFATPGFMYRLQSRGDVDEFTGLRVTAGKIDGDAFGAFEIGWSDSVDYVRSDRTITFPIIDWKTNDCNFLAIIARPRMPTPLLAYSYYGKGRFHVLNLPDVWADISALPVEVLTLIRKHMSAGIGVYLEGSSEIAVFPYDNRRVVLQSFLEHGSRIRLHVEGDVEYVRNVVTGDAYKRLYRTDGTSTFALSIAPRSQTVLSW